MRTILNVIALSLFLVGASYSDEPVRYVGIGVRATYMNFSNTVSEIRVIDYGRETHVNAGGAGGCLYLFSRIDDNTFVELSFGTVGKVEQETENWYGESMEAEAITPLLIGLKYNLLHHQNPSGFQPYIAFGAGPYWITHVIAREDFFEEEVTLKTESNRGGYLGGGFNFMLTNWAAINFDLKYHFISFNVNHEHSGPEYGIGLQFMWGRFIK